MYWIIHQILLGIHIFLAIVWVGGILFIGWGVFPIMKRMKAIDQRVFFQSLMERNHWIFTLAGVGVITTGFLLGTVVGPIKQCKDVWNSSFGTIWLTSLMIGIFTLSWGIFIGYKKTMVVLSTDTIWTFAENGDTKPLNKSMAIITALEAVEVVGFVSLLVCMLLL